MTDKAEKSLLRFLNRNDLTVDEIDSAFEVDGKDIGPILAGALLRATRTAPFESLVDLRKVKGIGPARIRLMLEQAKLPDFPREPVRPEPTRIHYAGRQLTQVELVVALEKEVEELTESMPDLRDFIGDSPYHMPPVGEALAEALAAVHRANLFRDLILLWQVKEKTKAEKDEEWVDNLRDEYKKEWEKYKEEFGDGADDWDTYWEWIKKFWMTRGRWKQGWFQVMEGVLAGKTGETKDKLEKRMRDLGKRISKEWAKDNTNRKIHSSHLKKWAKKLKKAAKKDTCNGEEIGKALKEIETEVDQLLR